MQFPGETVILYESRTIFREIFTDGRPLPNDPNPTWQGYSIGRWEGDDFVVETNGLNDKIWMDTNGHPLTESAHITERYRRHDYGHMYIQITVDDPKAYTKPHGPDYRKSEPLSGHRVARIGMRREQQRRTAHCWKVGRAGGGPRYFKRMFRSVRMVPVAS